MQKNTFVLKTYILSKNPKWQPPVKMRSSVREKGCHFLYCTSRPRRLYLCTWENKIMHSRTKYWNGHFERVANEMFIKKKIWEKLELTWAAKQPKLTAPSSDCLMHNSWRSLAGTVTFFYTYLCTLHCMNELTLYRQCNGIKPKKLWLDRNP